MRKEFVFFLILLFPSYSQSQSAWTPVNVPVKQYKVVTFPSNADTGFLFARNDSVIYKTINRGSNWFSVSTYPLQTSLEFGFFLNSGSGVLWESCFPGYDGQGGITSNGGVTWNPMSQNVNTIEGFYNTKDIVFVNQSTGYVCGSDAAPFQGLYYGVVNRTTNGGQTWSEVLRLSTVANDIHFENSTNGAVLFPSALHYTSNSGVNWTTYNHNIPNFQAGSMTNPMRDTIYIAGFIAGVTENRACIIKSTDGGNTFQISHLTSIADAYNKIIPLNSNTLYAVGFDGLISYTSNAGSTWNIQNSGTTNTLNDIWFLNKDTGFIAGNGILLKTFSGGFTSVVNVNVIPEGFYDPTTNLQNVSDTMRAYLCANISPYNVVDSAKAVIDSISHTISFVFDHAPNGTYYIKLIHRNCIETWSKPGGQVFISGTIMNYDFTNSSSQAFANNLKQVDNSPVRFAIYSGDVNQDGSVNLADLLKVFNDGTIFLTGYVPSDINGNNVVNLTDLLITQNNSSGFVMKKRP